MGNSYVQFAMVLNASCMIPRYVGKLSVSPELGPDDMVLNTLLCLQSIEFSKLVTVHVLQGFTQCICMCGWGREHANFKRGMTTHRKTFLKTFEKETSTSGSSCVCMCRHVGFT